MISEQNLAYGKYTGKVILNVTIEYFFTWAVAGVRYLLFWRHKTSIGKNVRKKESKESLETFPICQNFYLFKSSSV